MFSERHRRTALVFLVLLSVLFPAHSKVLVTVDEALRLAFPGATIERETVFLTKAEMRAASELSGEDYFDVHLVRTMEETLLVVVRPDGSIGRVEVISFDEPLDYLPREGWYRQFDGEQLDADLQIDRAIHAVTGATLTAVAAMAAARRVLGLHQVIEGREEGR